MAPPSIDEIIPDMGGIAGPVFLATNLNWALFGVLCVQCYFYYIGFPRDRLLNRCLVVFLITVETAQSIFVMHDSFFAYGYHFGNMEVLDAMQNNWFSVPIMTSIVSMAVQFFLAYRLWLLSRNILVTVLICLLALVQGTAGIVSGVQAHIINKFSLLPTKAFLSTAIWHIGSASCDVLIAGMMTYFLLKMNTGFRKTDMLVRKLVRLTIETGSLTAIFAVIDCGIFLAIPHKPYFAVPATVTGKMYANTAIAILNSRLKVSNSEEPASMDTNTSMMWNSARGGANSRPRVNVHLSQSVHTDAIPMSATMKDTRTFDEDHPSSPINMA